MNEEEMKALATKTSEMTVALTKAQNEAKEAAQKAAAEIELHGKAQAETKAEVVALNEKLASAEARLLEVEQKSDTLSMAHASMDYTDGIKSFLESEQFGLIASQKSRSEQVEIGDLWKKKAITTGASSAGAAIIPQHLQGVFADPDMPNNIRPLLAQGSTSALLIDYVRENTFTDNTAATAEGAAKPVSDLTLSKEEARVRKIANTVDVSMEALSDIPFLESYIRTRLMFGLKRAEDEALLFGDGTGENLFGLVPQATPFDAALLTQAGVTTPTILDKLFLAMIQASLSGYSASAYVLNPVDYAAAILTKTTDGAYQIANPTSSNKPTLWGLPVVANTKMVQGDFLTGAFKEGAQIFDRMTATLAISSENKDNFTKNMFTIRIEERLALALYSKKAFVTGSF